MAPGFSHHLRAPCLPANRAVFSHRLVPRRTAARRGFSLVELLCVITIISVMTALVVGGIFGFLKSAKLTNATNLIVDQLSLARQKALTQSSRVEVRFYQMANTDGGRSYRAIRAFLVGQDGIGKPLSKLYFLPDPIVIADPSTMPAQNTLFASTSNPTEDLLNAPATPYRSFSFYPTGRTDLETRAVTGTNNQWFITLYDKSARVVSNGLPANFAVIRVDETTGHVFIYRP